MPFDQQNSDYEKQYHSIFRKELVADRDNKILKEKYSSLTPWQRVQVARHPDRPHSTDYIDNLFSNFDLITLIDNFLKK